MSKKHIIKLHWKLFFPLVGLLWVIIAITMTYSVMHEKRRQMDNLQTRLVNVNATVIDAYERGVDLQNTVNFIRLFTGETTLEPLRLTVYDNNGNMIADNPETTILLHDNNGHPIPELANLIRDKRSVTLRNMAIDSTKCMVSALTSTDGKIYTFAALPYEGEVLTFLSTDPMVWIVVLVLAILSSVISFIGIKAVCRDVYALRDFANSISTDHIPDIDTWHFSKDELGDVSRNLVTLYRDKINAEQEKTRHERQISQNVKHELRTPVGIIKGYLDTVLADDSIPDDIRHRFLVRAQQNADRLTELINSVSEITHLDNNKTIKTSDFNFRDTIAQLAQDIDAGHTAGALKFSYKIPDNCCVHGHESLIINAMLNLIHNAAKYSGGTTIDLRWLREENGKHYFSFSDNGKGVAEEHLSQLFDLFYRVDQGRARKNGGMGLGLPIVHRTITALGGEIEVDNANNGGLQFTFSLPAASKPTNPK